MECSVNCEIDESRVPSSADGPAVLRALGTRTWPTTSGRRLRHTVYSLIGCPGFQSATYLLVRRTADGNREVLAVRRTRSDVPSLNLARIRRAGARWGANEVHVFRGATTEEERTCVVAELTRTLCARRGRSSRRAAAPSAALRSGPA